MKGSLTLRVGRLSIWEGVMGEPRREEGGKMFHQGRWENLGLSMGGWEGLVGGAPPKRVGRGRENSGGEH